jgi:hypothetical protein
MNNKEYKSIVKKAAKRFERLQELELKDSNGIKNRVNWFIAEYISKNQLKEFFREELLNNSETQIYLLRGHKKIPIMRVGNKVIKTNLIKRLDNLVNFLNEKEKEKLDFVKKLETLNWKYKFVSDEETGVNKLLLKNEKGEYVAIFSPGYYYGMINFQSYETKIIHDDTANESNLGKWKTKSYTIEQTTFNKRIDLTIEEIKDLLASIGRV